MKTYRFPEERLQLCQCALMCNVFCLPIGMFLTSLDFWVAVTNRRKLQVSIHFFYSCHSHVFNTSEGVKVMCFLCNLGALQEYLSTVMTLQYTEKPDYTLLKAGLHKSLQKIGGSLNESLNLQVHVLPYLNNCYKLIWKILL